MKGTRLSQVIGRKVARANGTTLGTIVGLEFL